MEISIVEGSLTGSFLFCEEYHKDVSLFFFERPIIYQQWYLSKPYTDFLLYKDFTVADTNCGEKVERRSYSRRVKNQSGKLVYYQRDKNKTGNYMLSVAALSTNIVNLMPSVESWTKRYRNQVTDLKRRWKLEDDIDNSEFKYSPFIAIGYLENSVYRENQLGVLTEIFEDCNVHFILYEDQDYLQASDIEHPLFDKNGNYRNRKVAPDTRKLEMAQYLRGKFVTPYKRRISQCTTEDEIIAVRNECFETLVEEIEVWNEWGDPAKVLDFRETSRIINDVDDSLQEWVYVYTKVVNGEWSRRRVKNWRYVRAKVRNEALRDKLERIRTEFQDNAEVPAFEDDKYRVDTTGIKVGMRGFCKRIKEAELESYSEYEKQKLEESRMTMRLRRHNNRDSFKNYHKSYNALKHEVTGTWEKRKHKLSPEQNKRWREMRKRMKHLEKMSAKKAKQDIKQRHIDFGKFTFEEMKSVDNEEVVGYYNANFLWNGRDTNAENRGRVPL